MVFISNWVQFLFVGFNFGGLSGVVYGLFGFCWIYSVMCFNELFLVSNSIVGFMLVWFILGFVDMLLVSMVNWVYLVGLLVGMVYVVFDKLFICK